jgi:hypothetical protein
VALAVGSVSADSGMSKAIYDQMDALLSPPLQAAVDGASGPAKAKAQEALDAARDGWKKLSFAIATGVVTHILSSLEVVGVETRGNVGASVSGSTGTAPPGPHSHSVSLGATQTSLTLTQSNDGPGRVR